MDRPSVKLESNELRYAPAGFDALYSVQPIQQEKQNNTPSFMENWCCPRWLDLSAMVSLSWAARPGFLMMHYITYSDHSFILKFSSSKRMSTQHQFHIRNWILVALSHGNVQTTESLKDTETVEVGQHERANECYIIISSKNIQEHRAQARNISTRSASQWIGRTQVSGSFMSCLWAWYVTTVLDLLDMLF